MEYRYCPKCGGALVERVVHAGDRARMVCLACGFVFYQDPKVAASLVLEVDGGIVMVRRDIDPGRGTWVVPGGFVDRGEHPAQAAVREAREEIHVEAVVDRFIGLYNEPPGYPVVLAAYAGHIVSGTPTAGDETSEVRAFAPGEMPWDQIVFENTKHSLRDYLEVR